MSKAVRFFGGGGSI